MLVPTTWSPIWRASISEDLLCLQCLGIRVLDGPLTDSMEAVAFNKHYQINDIYSCR
jgi:hypothetical protein